MSSLAGALQKDKDTPHGSTLAFRVFVYHSTLAGTFLSFRLEIL